MSDKKIFMDLKLSPVQPSKPVYSVKPKQDQQKLSDSQHYPNQKAEQEQMDKLLQLQYAAYLQQLAVWSSLHQQHLAQHNPNQDGKNKDEWPPIPKDTPYYKLQEIYRDRMSIEQEKINDAINNIQDNYSNLTEKKSVRDGKQPSYPQMMQQPIQLMPPIPPLFPMNYLDLQQNLSPSQIIKDGVFKPPIKQEDKEIQTVDEKQTQTAVKGLPERNLQDQAILKFLESLPHLIPLSFASHFDTKHQAIGPRMPLASQRYMEHLQNFMSGQAFNFQQNQQIPVILQQPQQQVQNKTAQNKNDKKDNKQPIQPQKDTQNKQQKQQPINKNDKNAPQNQKEEQKNDKNPKKNQKEDQKNTKNAQNQSINKVNTQQSTDNNPPNQFPHNSYHSFYQTQTSRPPYGYKSYQDPNGEEQMLRPFKPYYSKYYDYQGSDTPYQRYQNPQIAVNRDNYYSDYLGFDNSTVPHKYI